MMIAELWGRHGWRTVIPVGVFIAALALVALWPHEKFSPLISEKRARALFYSALAIGFLRIAWVEAPAVWRWLKSDPRLPRFVLIAIAAPLALLLFLNSYGEWRLFGLRHQESMTMCFGLIGGGAVAELLFRIWPR